MGEDAGLIGATGARRWKVDGEIVDYGMVGDVAGWTRPCCRHLLAGGYVPVVAPFSASGDGQVLNTNADTVAAEVAAALKVEKLFFVLKVPGLLSDPADPSSRGTLADLRPARRTGPGRRHPGRHAAQARRRAQGRGRRA